MKTRSKTVELVKEGHFDKTTLHGQLERIIKKGISPTLYKQGWTFVPPEFIDSINNTIAKIRLFKKMKREREGSDEVFARQADEVLQRMAIFCRESNWSFRDAEIENKVCPKQKFDFPMPEEIRPFFGHIYDRDAHIRIIHSSLKAAQASMFEQRNHCLLWGKPGCIAGDAIIELNRAGKSFKLPLVNLHNRFNGLQDTHGLAVWDKNTPTKLRCREADGTIRLHEIDFVIYSGDKETYTITLEDGKTVRATGEHLFLSENEWIKLEDLNIGDSIYVASEVVKTKEKYKKNSYREWYNMIGHPHANRKKSGRYGVPVHRLVKEAEMNGLKLEEYVSRLRSNQVYGLNFLPLGILVHHEDENCKNNSSSNLSMRVRESHSLHHAKKEAWKYVTAKTKLVKIANIEKFGVEPVYDIGLKNEPHNFLANGIVVHNCGKTETVVAFEKMVGPENVIKLDATSTTKAGAENLLLELDVVPPILLIEELEKCNPLNLPWLLGILDQRGEIIKTNARIGSQRKSARCLCVATVNNLHDLTNMMSGALASRFQHKIYFPRPTRPILEKILLREIGKVKGDVAWIKPILDYVLDIEKVNDPRRAISLLDGREKWLTNEYKDDLMAVREAMHTDNVELPDN